MRTGSLVNKIMSETNLVPELDEGITILMWTDRRAGTVVAIRKFTTGPKKGQVRELIVREDAAEIISGSSQDGSAQYAHKYNDHGIDHTFTRDRKGGWKSSSGNYLGIGFRETYYDPSF